MQRNIWWILLLAASPASAQSWGRVSGEVVDAEQGTALRDVNVVVDGTNYGTSTDPLGRFALQLPAGQYALRFSSVGFVSSIDTVIVSARIPVILTVRLTPGILDQKEIVIEERAPTDAGGATTESRAGPDDAHALQGIPSPSGHARCVVIK